MFRDFFSKMDGNNDTSELTTDKISEKEHLEEHHVDYNNAMTLGNIPVTGMTFQSEIEAYDFYNSYAKAVGFSIRRQNKYTRPSDKKLIWRVFCCSCQGKREKHPSGTPKKSRPQTRFNCEAKLKITLKNDKGEYKIEDHVEHHTHELVDPNKAYMLRSHRVIRPSQLSLINNMAASGIGSSDIYHYCSKEAGGYDNLNFSQADYNNVIQKRRREFLKKGDGVLLLDYFKKKKKENSSFEYMLQLDEKNQIRSCFWCDAKSKVDYECFGDVVCFDTTYKTNGGRVREVEFSDADKTVKCPCKNFEFNGIPCAHMLKVSRMKNVTTLPPQYFLNRWSKNAVPNVIVDTHGKKLEVDANIPLSERYNVLSNMAQILVTMGSVNNTLTEVAKHWLKRAIEEVEACKETKQDDVEAHIDNNVEDPNAITGESGATQINGNITIWAPPRKKIIGEPAGRRKCFYDTMKKNGRKRNAMGDKKGDGITDTTGHDESTTIKRQPRKRVLGKESNRKDLDKVEENPCREPRNSIVVPQISNKSTRQLQILSDLKFIGPNVLETSAIPYSMPYLYPQGLEGRHLFVDGGSIANCIFEGTSSLGTSFQPYSGPYVQHVKRYKKRS